MTKRELIKALEALNCPDSTQVTLCTDGYIQPIDLVCLSKDKETIQICDEDRFAYGA